jgi:serine/threonine protein kinase
VFDAAAEWGIPGTRSSGEYLKFSIISDYELLQPIGKGSYGEVWLARSTATGALRAIKIVHRSKFSDPRPSERELEGIKKFETISRAHPSQLALFHVGRNDEGGYFYYVMELADALPGGDDVRSLNSNSAKEFESPHVDSYKPRTLRADLQNGRLPAARVLELGLVLSEALTHLHSQGLVHRDIKPSNIIFVNGRPKLADIGLVTDASDECSIVGTEGYLSPEGPGTSQADIYALGKVVYEAATGLDRRLFPKLPSDIREWKDAPQFFELNEVILRACAIDTRYRYGSAEEIRADLSCLQVGGSVQTKMMRYRRLGLVKRSLWTAVLLLMAAGSYLLFRDKTNRSYRLSKSPIANKEYLEGVQCSLRDTEEGAIQAIDHFNRAIQIDPGFTMAYNGLFESYGDSPRRRTMANKLMELDPSLAEAHAAMALLDFYEWKWFEAEREFKRAIALYPKCAIAHMRYGFCLTMAGRPDEGQKELLIAEMLDPVLPRIKKNLGHVFYMKRRFPEAIAQYQKALDLEPSYTVSLQAMGFAYRALGDYTNSIDHFERYELAVGRAVPEKIHNKFDELRRGYANEGPEGYWRKSLEQAQRFGNIHDQAVCYAHLRDNDCALDLLKKAYATNGYLTVGSPLWPECWDAVHDDPRFIAVLKKTGFSQ